MTAVSTDRLTIQCCGCGGKYTIPRESASGLSILNVACPHCGKKGALVKGCKR